MSGLVPDSIAGTVVVVDQSGNVAQPVPQPGLFNNYGSTFTITGGLSYLAVPTATGSCGGRVTPMQVNFIESELLALAQAFNARFTWTSTTGNNLATAFTAVAIPTVNVVDLFNKPVGMITGPASSGSGAGTDAFGQPID